MSDSMFISCHLSADTPGPYPSTAPMSPPASGSQPLAATTMVTREQCLIPSSGMLALPYADVEQQDSWWSVLLILIFISQSIIGVWHSLWWVCRSVCCKHVPFAAVRNVKTQSMTTYTAVRKVAHPRFELTSMVQKAIRLSME